ncbi:hypothetical protein CROQUDRAFT_101161 [Cronartium quercuum f. sp. fusiforme G11]|uniref:Uncharacterized protein n=1 Tax=Cronartium quercuum f. sp. fusiforme G11 TaxID=708437 RepID=A0A9P6N8H5_9BASI|nr:hypothetical protein CROQUDRAFT_101161 [Cronartium quercuum f. sp. fusiforme G11]
MDIELDLTRHLSCSFSAVKIRYIQTPISLNALKPEVVALSTSESEYMAASNALRHLAWI